jgi:hypothetical protein
MYSSEDLERFYFQYQTEFIPNGISIGIPPIERKVRKRPKMASCPKV